MLWPHSCAAALAAVLLLRRHRRRIPANSEPSPTAGGNAFEHKHGFDKASSPASTHPATYPDTQAPPTAGSTLDDSAYATTTTATTTTSSSALAAATVGVSQRACDRLSALKGGTAASAAPAPYNLALSTDPLLTFINSMAASQRAAELSGSVPRSPGTAAFDARPWLVRWDDIEVMHPIGRGSFGAVYLATFQQTPVAVKILEGGGAAAAAGAPHALALPTAVLRRLEEEAGVMAVLRHPNVLAFMGVCTSPVCAILTEHCMRGSLSGVLAAARADPMGEAAAALTWRRRLGMALGAARGTLCLHSRSPPIIHRDLKSPNILLDQGWNAKVGGLPSAPLALSVTVQ